MENGIAIIEIEDRTLVNMMNNLTQKNNLTQNHQPIELQHIQIKD